MVEKKNAVNVNDEFVKLQKDLLNLKIVKDKTAKRKTFSYKYISLHGLFSIILPFLHERGFYIKQQIIPEDNMMIVKTTLFHESNHEPFLSSAIPFNITNDTLQTGANITYARKYTLLTLLNLTFEEDIDADNYTPKSSPEKKTTVKALSLVDKLNASDKQKRYIKGLLSQLEWGEDEVKTYIAKNKDTSVSKIIEYLLDAVKGKKAMEDIEKESDEILEKINKEDK